MRLEFVSAKADGEDRSEIDLLDRHWAQLMAKAQDGDRHAYAELLKEIAPVFRAIARRHHGSPDRAEDVVQDILLAIHRVRHTYDPSRSFRGWAFTIARRRSIDALRKRICLARYEKSAEPEAVERIAAEDEAAAAFEHHSELDKALATLPPGQRAAIELVKLKELSLAEAAILSGVSAGALKVAVFRAMKSLRIRLAGDLK